MRLRYLVLTNVFTFIRLLPMSDVDKNVEILALRHQLAILQRQIDRPRLTPPDRALLAALLHRLLRARLRQLHLIVSPDTVLRWHRDLLRRHHAKASRRKRPAGRPPLWVPKMPSMGCDLALRLPSRSTCVTDLKTFGTVRTTV
jgi:putative transposase